MSTIRQIICWFASIDWTPEAITAAGTIALAFLTLVLAIGTLFLWLATRRLVRGSEKTAERQLRAYVFPFHNKIEKFDTSPLVNVGFKNSGQTPAYDVTVWTVVGIAAYPFANKPEQPINIQKSQKSGHIGPGAEMHTICKLGRSVTTSETTAVTAGTAALYVYGELTYQDAFGKPRFTHVCFFHGGSAGCNTKGLMATYYNWNDAN